MVHRRKRYRVGIGIAVVLLFPPCLAFRPTSSHVSCRNRYDHESTNLRQKDRQCFSGHRKRTWRHDETLQGSEKSGLSSGLRVRARNRRQEDVMEKIGPLIEEVARSREMIPSDLTKDYGSVILPDPLTVPEVTRVG